MAIVITALVGLVALGAIGLILRNYRRQSDWQDGPGNVPEDYS